MSKVAPPAVPATPSKSSTQTENPPSTEQACNQAYNVKCEELKSFALSSDALGVTDTLQIMSRPDSTHCDKGVEWLKLVVFPIFINSSLSSSLRVCLVSRQLNILGLPLPNIENDTQKGKQVRVYMSVPFQLESLPRPFPPALLSVACENTVVKMMKEGGWVGSLV